MKCLDHDREIGRREAPGRLEQAARFATVRTVRIVAPADEARIDQIVRRCADAVHEPIAHRGNRYDAAQRFEYVGQYRAFAPVLDFPGRAVGGPRHLFVAPQVEVDAIEMRHQVELQADIVTGEAVHDIGKRRDRHSPVLGGKGRDWPDAQRHLVNCTKHAIAQAEGVQQVLLLMRHFHEFAGRGHRLEADHLVGQVGPPADAGAEAR